VASPGLAFGHEVLVQREAGGARITTIVGG
jgi:hypothetical protein